jgi:hypothetical protein
MENNAPVPQTAFASVNQSASWNSRIMEKGLRGVWFCMVILPKSNRFGGCPCHLESSFNVSAA